METVDLLKEHGVRPTVVRMKLYDYLISRKNHPTADTLYKSLINEIPTLSRTSVYNTMDLFLEKNLVQTITIEDNEVRYDADTSAHGHFKCTGCSEIYDFDADLSAVTDNLPETFTVTERILHYKGVCENCRS